MYRLLARDAGGETEGVLLNETVPAWVVDIVVEKKLPKFIKVTFFVLPHPTLGYKTFKRERLIANDFLQIRKVKIPKKKNNSKKSPLPLGDRARV